MPAAERPARIGFLLSQLGTRSAEVFAEQVRALGVTPSEAGVVRIIGRGPAITQRELADRLGTAPSRVVALVDGLERKGLAQRTRGETDRRAQHLGLTESGRALLDELRKAAEAQEATIAKGLSAEQRGELHVLLTALAASLGLDVDVHPGYRHGTPDGPHSESRDRLKS
ncbi:MarR family winged helix-turn-helix transcriptional regulator [Humibacter ginsenosidimutans]|uniref:MarR family transcriptional regulator n=1 Tax=Humibacter ginsenosidimutans TaxID=2599293 RepID=A0A5B8M6E5_9MICO|nr:MarR family transcriptional regulator [Humibacter ginsenosidimutans]QDZ15886.1 MarR family transcriptional regulator [Humibacter ginsenosidimutans]